MASSIGELRLTWAGLLLGIGLGGFLDGIVFNQLLQWHHLLSSVRAPVEMYAMRYNVWADGWFHMVTWVSALIGAILLWRGTQSVRIWRGDRWFIGTLVLGWGLFNLVEGLVSHQLLGIHHVRVHPDPWWDWGYVLVLGIGLILFGLLLRKQGERSH